MKWFACYLSILALCLTGCKKSAPPEPAAAASQSTAPATPVADAAPPPPPAPPVPGGAAPTASADGDEPGLAEVNRALSAYLMGQLKAPDKLEDLVKAGLIKRLPTPPPGKRYVLNGNKTTVVLADR